jgi:hypothetical protein
MAHRADASWFYKLSGDTALVEAQKPAFIEFLKSIQMKPAPASGTASVPPGEATKFNWKVPAKWTALPAGEMQVARFALPERGAAKAEVFVSVFGNDTGGTLANVNRWRRELGLRETDAAGLSQSNWSISRTATAALLPPSSPATGATGSTSCAATARPCRRSEMPSWPS